MYIISGTRQSFACSIKWISIFYIYICSLISWHLSSSPIPLCNRSMEFPCCMVTVVTKQCSYKPISPSCVAIYREQKFKETFKRPFTKLNIECSFFCCMRLKHQFKLQFLSFCCFFQNIWEVGSVGSGCSLDDELSQELEEMERREEEQQKLGSHVAAAGLSQPALVRRIQSIHLFSYSFSLFKLIPVGSCLFKSSQICNMCSYLLPGFNLFHIN